MQAINQTAGNIIANDLKIADSFYTRMKGLLGKSSLSEGEGLMLRPCMGVHTIGMHFPIDLIFLDKQSVVVATCTLRPNRMSAIYFSARSVIELPAGTIDKSGTKTGDLISFY